MAGVLKEGNESEADSSILARIRERARTSPRARFLVVAAGAGLTAGCGGTKPRETSKTPIPESGTLKNEKVGAWDPIIEAYIEKNPQAQKQIKDDWEAGRGFFAVSVTHRHGVDENFKGVMILPLSPDLPESIKGVDQTIFYAIGTKDGRLLRFPEGSSINSLSSTPNATIGREVLDELEESLVDKEVTVVRTRVLAPNGQGQMKPTLGTILLDRFPPRRKDAFLQLVREKLLTKKKILEVRKGIPLVLQCFPAKIIKENDKIIYTQADRIA